MKFTGKEIFTLSNFLSALRALLLIPMWMLMNNLHDESYRYALAGFCIFAGITDILDGYFARKFNQVTELGKIIDPLADKILIIAIILKLFFLGEIPAYYFYMIIGRDLLIFFGGIILTNRIGKVLPSNVLGKITVVFIGIVILMILLYADRTVLYFKFFYYTSILLIFASLAAYTMRAVEFIRKRDDESFRKLQF